jgi:hypothetical protein
MKPLWAAAEPGVLLALRVLRIDLILLDGLPDFGLPLLLARLLILVLSFLIRSVLVGHLVRHLQISSLLL